MIFMRRTLAVSVLAGLVAGSASADIIIDDFSSVGIPTPWPVLINTISSVDVLETGLTGVIGGARYSTVRATFLEELGLDFVQAAIVPNFGMILDYSSTSGANGDWNLQYDANGAGLNANFSTINDIVLGFSRFDFANDQPLPVLVTLFDGANFATLSRSLTVPGPQGLHFEFAGFAGIGSLDLASIQSVGVFLDPALAADFRLSGITGVPAPGSLALLAVGSLALAGGRRRRDSAV